MPDILETRRILRTEKLTQREALPPEARTAASAAIEQRMLELVRDRGWKVLHCYLAFRSEVTTNSLIEKMLAEGFTVVVPVVEPDGDLSHHQLIEPQAVSDGPYGVPHPARNEFTKLDTIDAVLLPLAAFDRSGNRLGYGKGFYDRFLATLPTTATRIGLAFAIQEAQEIAAMDHDQKLDMIVTEQEIIIIAA